MRTPWQRPVVTDPAVNAMATQLASLQEQLRLVVAQNQTLQADLTAATGQVAALQIQLAAKPVSHVEEEAPPLPRGKK